MIEFKEENKNKLIRYFSVINNDKVSYGEYRGFDNYNYGDAYIIFSSDNRKINIDYKTNVRGRKYIPIELIQISSTNTYNSWLYNNNIDYVAYEFDNDIYLFEKDKLQKICKCYLNLPRGIDIYKTSTVLNSNYVIDNYDIRPYKAFIEYNLRDIKLDMNILNEFGNISTTDVHVNCAFNKINGKKKLSGLCLNLPLNRCGKYKI